MCREGADSADAYGGHSIFKKGGSHLYQALYRKWRPKTFSDVIGQTAITETLRRQAAEGKLSHAYLFTGTRGTGKTTCAKILAKAANCENLQNGDPCGVCPACVGIDSGAFLDVLELDAASNNGVDHVRALRDEAIYSPVHVRRRVYIVDEVHMLSTPAFNALLKILEEPPAHLMFILATTELHKVPATILSRCQRFSFQRLQPSAIAQRLQYVAAQEGIPLAPDGAELLSRLADGALRDGLSLLDQCAASGDELNAKTILDCLGLAGKLQTAQLMGCILRHDTAEALLRLNDLYQNGRDVASVLQELGELNRDLLLQQAAPQGADALLSGGFDRSTLQELLPLASLARRMAMATVLQETLASMNSSVNRRTEAELCLLRLCDESLCEDWSGLVARIERLESGLVSAPPVPAASPVSAAASVPKPAAEDAPPWEETPLPEPPPERTPSAPPWEEAPERTPAAPAAAPAPSPAGSGTLWAQLLESCKNRLPVSKRSWLSMAGGQLQNDILTVYCGSELALKQMDCPEVEAVLQEQFSQAAGRTVHVKFSSNRYQPPAQDRLQDLIQCGAKLDHFEVK